MPKAKAAPNFQPMLEEGGDALTPEEQAAQAAEERGETPAVVPEEGEQPEGQTAEPAEASEKGGKAKPPKTIPYDRFSEVVNERNQTKAQLEQLNQQLAEQRERWGRLDERQKLAQEAVARGQQAEAAAKKQAERPDPDVDPSGARAWDAMQDAQAARAEVQRLTEFVNGRSQELQGWTQQQQLGNWVQSQANAGRQKYAYYDQAVDYARETRRNFWQSMGHTPENAAKIVMNEEGAMVASAAQAGIPLFDEVVKMATLWGFKPPVNGNARVNGSAKLDQVAAGQRVQGQGRTQSAEAPVQLPWQQMDDQAFATFIVGMEDSDYLEMTKNKEFNKRVASLDVR